MEHRWGRRVHTDIKVQIFADPASAGWGRLRDISISGGFVETALTIPVLSTLCLTVPAAQCRSRCVVHGIVIRSGTEGVGVEWFDGDSGVIARLMQKSELLEEPLENTMTTRIVLADQAEARFYDVEPIGGALRCVGEMSDPKAHLHDRDLKSDRPGRVFDHAPESGHRRGAVAHHATGGEETPRRHEALAFASRIVHSLEAARNAHEFDQLALIAGPRFIGMLRGVMPRPLADLIVVEVVKDLIHESEDAIRSHLPVTVVSAKAHLPA